MNDAKCYTRFLPTRARSMHRSFLLNSSSRVSQSSISDDMCKHSSERLLLPVYDKDGQWVNSSVPKGEKKARGGLSPRRAGDRVERLVAKELGEKRNVGSGAFKNTNKNLTGDLDIHDNNGKAI